MQTPTLHIVHQPAMGLAGQGFQSHSFFIAWLKRDIDLFSVFGVTFGSGIFRKMFNCAIANRSRLWCSKQWIDGTAHCLVRRKIGEWFSATSGRSDKSFSRLCHSFPLSPAVPMIGLLSQTHTSKRKGDVTVNDGLLKFFGRWMLRRDCSQLHLSANISNTSSSLKTSLCLQPSHDPSPTPHPVDHS